jgi:hypothetical protein
MMTMVLRGLRLDWRLWAARLGRACFCVLGGLFFWWLLGGVAQAEPAPLTNQVESIVDSVVDDVTQAPATGVAPVNDVTSTVANVVRGLERSVPPVPARPETPAPPQIPAPPVAAAPAPAPVAPSPAPANAISPLPANAGGSAAPAVELAPASTEDSSTPGMPVVPIPQAPFAASSSGAQSLDAQVTAAPPPANQRRARLIPRNDNVSDVRVTRPEVFPD